MKWTDDLRKEVVRMVQDGMSATQIGAKLGVSRNSVCGALDRMRKKRPTSNSLWNDRQSLLVLRLHDEGRQWHEIGEAIGRTGHKCQQHYNDIIRELEASERK